MWSINTKNGVRDIKYKRYGDFGWLVFLDEKLLGTAFNTKGKGWDIIIEKDSCRTVETVEGFMSRDKAVAHLLKVLGFHWDDRPYENDYLIFKINMKYGV